MRSLNRRELLVALAALGVAGADGPAPLLREGLLPDPDFTRLRADPYIVGVRPHRMKGIRLELDPEPLGKLRVVHNYGHGGAGITLSWGCAAQAVLHVAEVYTEGARIAVIGGGVIGLTTATELRARFPGASIAIYSKDELRNTTSYRAGGQFEPSGIWRAYKDRPEVLAGLLRASKERMVGLPAGYGVAARDNYTLDHDVPSMDEYTPRDVIPEHRAGALPFARLNVPGRCYSTWLMNPTILLPRLKTELEAAGVRFETVAFTSRDELARLPADIVVNCTGYGAKALFGDDALIAQRGHLVALEKTQETQDWFFSGGCENLVTAYVFCRHDDIVVGGTVIKEEDGMERVPEDDAVFAQVLTNAREVFEGDVGTCQTP